jgi:hypothetical protein
MEEPTRAPKEGLISQLLFVVQGIVCASVALAALALAIDLRKVNVPDAPVALLGITLTVAILLAVAHAPAVFMRMPRWGRLAAYGAIIPSLVLVGFYFGQMRAAWERTAEGAQEAADHAKKAGALAKIEEVRQAEQAKRDETERKLAELKSATDQLQAINEKLEGCFSTFGHRLPALEEPVKAALHNPDAYEHVETTLIVPTDENENSNVEMRFRAENGFGAIRTARVLAQLIPDDCSVRNVGQPESE